MAVTFVVRLKIESVVLASVLALGCNFAWGAGWVPT